MNWSRYYSILNQGNLRKNVKKKRKKTESLFLSRHIHCNTFPTCVSDYVYRFFFFFEFIFPFLAIALLLHRCSVQAREPIDEPPSTTTSTTTTTKTARASEFSSMQAGARAFVRVIFSFFFFFLLPRIDFHEVGSGLEYRLPAAAGWGIECLFPR